MEYEIRIAKHKKTGYNISEFDAQLRALKEMGEIYGFDFWEALIKVIDISKLDFEKYKTREIDGDTELPPELQNLSAEELDRILKEKFVY